MNDVYLVRHGETEWNLTGRRQGRSDSPLTTKGRADTLAIARSPAIRDVDALFTSPLGRARASAAIIAVELGLDAVVVDQLHEIDHGDFSGLTNDEVEHSFPGELTRRRLNHYTWRFPHGESYEDGSDRARAALELIRARDCRSPLLIVHEMIGRLLLGELLKLTPEDALRRSLGHGVVIHVNVTERTSNERRLDATP